MPTKQAMVETMQKPKNDILYTPEGAIKPLLSLFYEYGVDQYGKTIWECTDPGMSKITKLFKEENYNVMSTDIVTGFDFLKDTPDFDFDMIVTNPPYSIKDDFIEKCYEYNKPFALLLPITALEGIRRNKMYREYGISLLVMDKRFDFTGTGKNWFNTSWFLGRMFKDDELFFAEI